MAAFDYYRGKSQRRYKLGSYPYRNVPLHVAMQEINKLALTRDERTLAVTTACYDVADTYHPHRFHSAADGMKSPYETFSDDDDFKAALAKELEMSGRIGTEHFGLLCLSQGTQACANFRPGYALLQYRTYCKPGAVVLDTSTGYGGRLVGFIASGLTGTYIGVEPNAETHAGNTRLAQELQFADHVELINSPVEDVDPSVLAGRCDFAFTSPPYFTKEHYSVEDTQAWVRYPTPESWRAGFLLPMLRLTYAALKPGALALVNIADVWVNGAHHQIDEWTRECAQEAGFEWVRKEDYPLPRGLGLRDETGQQRVEPVLVFQKPLPDDSA